MIRAADSSAFEALNHLVNFPETSEKFMFPSRAHETGNENKGASSIPVDILDTPKEYIFFLDVPGVSKSDIQERKAVQKLPRKFRLPGNANVAAITAKCENGVLTVVVEKLPPPPKPNPVEVSIS